MSDFFKSVRCKQIELVIFIPHKDNRRNGSTVYSLRCLGLLWFVYTLASQFEQYNYKNYESINENSTSPFGSHKV